jgi:predicted nucleic acid-binding protein
VYRSAPDRNGSIGRISALETKRRELQEWLRRLVDALGGRILGFNVSIARVRADQEHVLEKQGRRMPVEDAYIAATARRHGLTIATANDKDSRRPGGEHPGRSACLTCV